MEYARDCKDEIIGNEFSMTFCERYDWADCWPIIERDADGRLMIVDIYEPSGVAEDDEYTVADVRDGQIVHVGEGNDVAIHKATWDIPDTDEFEDEDD